MSMKITVSEDAIAWAIQDGDIGLSEIIAALERKTADNGEFAELLAADVSRFLDAADLHESSPLRRVLGTIEVIAELIDDEFTTEMETPE